MADHFPDFQKKVDYISLDSVCLNKRVFYHPKDGIARNNGYDPADWAIRISDVMDVPAADVVARDCYDRILAENDTMRKMLAQIGKKCGDSIDDVRPVVRGKWEVGGMFDDIGRCSCCHYMFPSDTTMTEFRFCPNCGADMRPDKNGQIGEKNRG